MAKSELFGDWNKLKRVLHNLNNNHQQYEQVIISMGNKITERIWDLIESQSIFLEPLQEEYKKRKIAEGKDERTLIRSGDFLNSIQVIDIRSDGEELTVFIGVEDGITETGIPMRELAEYIEYGTVNQPARMPFQRSWEEMRNEVANEVMNQLKEKIEVTLR